MLKQANIKLIVSDMDGTLLNENHVVSEQFFSLFKQLKTKNILFVAASGRTHKSIIQKLNPIKNDIIVVSENGAIAIRKEKLLVSTPILTHNFKNLVHLISQLDNTFPVYCGRHQVYIKKSNEVFRSLLKEYYPEHVCVSDEAEIKEPIYKIALFHSESSEQFIYPHVKHLENEFKVKVSANHWVDISENLAHKGHAISYIQEKFDILPEETMVFGDYKNDIEMLQRSKYSYAMENAHPEVKAVANYLTLSHKEQGVEHILSQLI